jgi:hypothetical protein
MSKNSLLYPVLLLCALLISPVAGHAASALSISSPSGDGVFVLQGTGLKNVNGMELSVAYDAATLANPRVQMGSLVRGMVSAVNSTNPLRLAVLSGSQSVSGDGTIATITFDRTGSSPGRITSLKGDLRDLKGQKISLQALVVDPAFTVDPPRHSEEPQPAPDQNDDSSNPPAQQDPSQPYVGGTVTMPEETPPPPEQVDQTPPPQEYPQQVPEWDQGSGESGTPAPDSGIPSPALPAATPPSPVTAATQGSVLERFRLYQGERTPQLLLSFFQQSPDAPFTQYPAVAIADGKETVSLVIRKVPADVTPRFVFESARFVSLGKGDGGEWEVEVRPDKGAVNASVKALVKDKWQEMPLTVAPKAELPAKTPGTVTEADLALFLKERGSEAAPKYDLNGDGKRDYVDDYIYCVNYLVKLSGKKKLQDAPK